MSGNRLLKMCLFFINFYNVPEKLFMVFNIPIHYLTQVKFEENMRKYCHWFAKIQSEMLPSQNSCTYLQEISEIWFFFFFPVKIL